MKTLKARWDKLLAPFGDEPYVVLTLLVFAIVVGGLTLFGCGVSNKSKNTLTNLHDSTRVITAKKVSEKDSSSSKKADTSSTKTTKNTNASTRRIIIDLDPTIAGPKRTIIDPSDFFPPSNKSSGRNLKTGLVIPGNANKLTFEDESSDQSEATTTEQKSSEEETKTAAAEQTEKHDSTDVKSVASSSSSSSFHFNPNWLWCLLVLIPIAVYHYRDKIFGLPKKKRTR